MPDPSAVLLMSIDGGGVVRGAQTISASGSHSVQFSIQNSTGINNYLWEIYEYPSGMATPSGWTLVGNSIQSTAATPPAITWPAAWGDYMLRLTGNGGLLNGQPSANLVDTTSAIRILSPQGFKDVAFLTTNQFDSIRQWVGALKDDLRIIDTVLTTGAPAGARALVASGGSFTVANGVATFIRANPNPSNCSITFPSSPVDGQTITVKTGPNTSGSTYTSIGSGAHVEDPAALGNFHSSITLTQPGEAVSWIYIQSDNLWEIY